MDEDPELLQDFRTESLEHMSEIEPLFLEIEDLEGDEQNDVVNQIFRAAHSVKGAAGFFGLDRIQNLAHTMENLLMRVRDGELAYHTGMTDALLAGVDKLTQLISALPEIVELSIDDEVANLKPLIEGSAAAPAPEAPAALETEAPATTTDETPGATAQPAAQAPTTDAAPPPASAGEPAAEPSEHVVSIDGFPAFEVDPEVAEEAARFGQRIFGVVLPEVLNSDGAGVEEAHSRIAALGKVVGAAVDPGEDDPLALQVATVLEEDLLQGALGLGDDQMTLLRDRVQMSEDRLVQAMSNTPGEGESQPSTGAEPSAAASAGEAPAAQAAGGGGGGSKASGKKKAPAKKMEAIETVRVSVDLLDKLMTLAGELVLGRNQLLARLDQSDDPGIKGVLQNLDIVTSDMQSNIMNTRMQQVGNVFKKYHRVVRDLSRKLGKRVDLEIEGSEVELDKSIIELLSDPLTHLVRNSLDHGMEAPAKRAEHGKSEVGQIRLSAYHEGGQVNIEIADDGKGLPLIRLENELSVNPISDSGEYYVLIPNANGSAGGILASRVIDTVDTEIAIDHSSDDPACVSGRALIEGRLTTILDAESLLGSALGESL
ncbi:MAG: Hpt domain-containing protein [Myxococcota bacterium]|jgi:two-component system chemotaxis sensor kinase CheA|nr:Hpt domain-containing protein [Myxococcota bacterium]